MSVQSTFNEVASRVARKVLSEPLVCAVMLTKDRPQMAARAVRAFREQTYGNKRLLVLDTGTPPAIIQNADDIYYESNPWFVGKSIGELRNIANGYTNQHCLNAEIIIHWDDDDWSHPNRIAEQVAYLQSSGADVVGYDELLFWRVPNMARSHGKLVPGGPGEAWIYRNKLAKAGTSFCYWRKTWEARPFPDLPRPERGACGEDWEWAAAANMGRVSGIPRTIYPKDAPGPLPEPRIIASIHGANTSSYEIVEGANWHRAPEFDLYCQERMKLGRFNRP